MDCVEVGGFFVGVGCGGYVVGEIVKLLKEFNVFDEYDVILFDVLGDVVCGGFVVLLNYVDYCLIVIDNGFDVLFVVNCIVVFVWEKVCIYSFCFVGLIGNCIFKWDLIDKYIEVVFMLVLEILFLIEDIWVFWVKGKILFEMVEFDFFLNYVCDYYLNIVD